LILSFGCRRDSPPQIIYSNAERKLSQGFFEAAIQEADRGYQTSQGQSFVWAWRFKILKAEVYLRQNKPSQSLELVGDPVPALPFEVSAHRAIVQGEALCRLNRHSEAETSFNQVDQLIPPAQKGLQSAMELAKGRCASLVDRALAKQHFTNAAHLAHGEDGFVEGIALLNLGFALLQEEHYDQSIEQLSRVPSVTDSPYAREKAFGDLGFIYSQLGDWKTAISFSQQAETLAEEIKNSEDQERWLNDLGRAHFALWELPEAETYYLHSLSIAQQLHDPSGSATCLNNLARLALRRGDLKKAEVYVEQGKALKIERADRQFSLDAAEITAAREQFAEAERMFRELLGTAKLDAVFQSMVQQDLGRVCWHEKKPAQADEMFRDGIATAEKALSELKRPEYRMSFMDQIPFYDPYINFLVVQNRPAEALTIAERSRAQVLAAALENGKARDPSLSVAALRALSKRRGQVVLAYSMTDEKTFLWVISPTLFKLFELAGHRALSPQIDAFNKEIQDHRNLGDSPAAIKLYQSLIQPAEELIPRGASVVIIPSKLLSLVNFEALVVPGAQPHYWIEDVDVQVAGSLALYAHERSAPKKNLRGMKELLSLGAPVEASKDYPVLKHAPEEMQRVQTHFPADQATVISGQEAAPQAYRASSPGMYRFLHLDTHAAPSDLNPLESAVILSKGADGSYKLTAQEIKDIPRHADLVTISACYGAGTRWYQGEGLVGLTWAFLHAGAHQVVGALWEVDDASSPQLMDDFYGELTQGKSATEALRDAKLKMLHSNTFYRHPYYWATLQLYTGS
jgi:CHAT domain-containing protein